MTSVKDKIKHLLSKGITRSELQQIAKQLYEDRLTYSTRKPSNGTSRAITALNLIYYNQWVLGPYLRELRFNKLPWYKRIFGGKNHGINPVGKNKSTRTVKTKGGKGRAVKDRAKIDQNINQKTFRKT